MALSDVSKPTNDCLTLTFASTQAADLFSFDCAARDRVAVQISTAGTGCTVSYEVTNQSTGTWYAIGGYAPSAPATESVTTSTQATLLVFRLDAKFFRARVSTYGSGTVDGVAQLTSVYAS